ncbi:phosphodiesterase [Natronospora cellulosivora (SeqCode)]
MNYLILSDTHGSLKAWQKAEKYYDDMDMILHAGDLLYHGARNPLPEGYNTKGLVEKINNCPLGFLAIKGNVDSLVDDWVLPYPLSEYSILIDNDLKIAIYHGYQHQTEDERIDFAKCLGADILIYGHTHLPELKKVDDIILLNPGSMSLPKQENKVPSIAKMENGDISILSLETGDILKSYSIDK